MRPLAYAKDLAARRRNGERVGLLVLSLGDWEAGKWFEGRAEVARLVLPEDLPVAEADWSVCLALDVLVCGGSDEATFYAALDALQRAGAASLWGEFADGVWLMAKGERSGRWLALDGPLPLPKLGAALQRYRTAATVLAQGFYRSRIFDGARAALREPLVEALGE